MSTVLVTGCAGFLGSHVCDHLIKNGHTVVGVDDLSGGELSNVPVGMSFHEANCGNVWFMEVLFTNHKFDHIIHCAAMAAENLSHNCRMFTYNNNVLPSLLLINLAVKYQVKCFVNLSSIAVYGHQQPPFTEETVPMPKDPYGISKRAVEQELEAAHEFFGLNYVTWRPHNIAGTRQNLADATRNVVSIFIRQCIEEKPITIFGDGNQTRAFSPVSGVAPLIAGCIDRPDTWNQTYNIGGDKPLSVKHIAALVREEAHKRGFDVKDVEYLPARLEAVHAFCDHSKVKRAFVQPEEESIEDCIADMFNEAACKPLRPMMQLPPVEITTNLPESWKKLLS